MSAVDHAWYRMDSPANLMMVHAIMWTDEPVDRERLHDLVEQRMILRFPKFRQHPVPARLPFGRAHWQDDQTFDPARHLVHHRLRAPGDQRALAAYVGEQIPLPLAPDHPMWQIHVIDGYGSGTAVLFRMHHSIADGITLTRVLLSLTCEGSDGPGFTAREDHGLATQVAGLAWRATAEGVRTARDPGRLVKAASLTIRGARRLAHLATIPQKPDSALAGEVGTTKHVTWTQPWPLSTIKGVGQATGVTINEVLLCVLADALGRYLRDAGTPLDSVRVMVPVNLRPLDRPLTSDLGNVFGEYVVSLPTGDMAPLERLRAVHAVSEDLKDSPEAVVAYLTLVAIGLLPDPVEDLATRLFSGKVVATVSNVPGPTTPVVLAGTRVAGIIGWVPGAGDVGLGVSMFSYNGHVVVGVIADTTLIPDLDRLHQQLIAGLTDLVAATEQPATAPATRR
jgi:diacylglycerol O-acyltransferase / wax synthase